MKRKRAVRNTSAKAIQPLVIPIGVPGVNGFIAVRHDYPNQGFGPTPIDAWRNFYVNNLGVKSKRA